MSIHVGAISFDEALRKARANASGSNVELQRERTLKYCGFVLCYFGVGLMVAGLTVACEYDVTTAKSYEPSPVAVIVFALLLVLAAFWPGLAAKVSAPFKNRESFLEGAFSDIDVFRTAVGGWQYVQRMSETGSLTAWSYLVAYSDPPLWVWASRSRSPLIEHLFPGKPRSAATAGGASLRRGLMPDEDRVIADAWGRIYWLAFALRRSRTCAPALERVWHAWASTLFQLSFASEEWLKANADSMLAWLIAEIEHAEEAVLQDLRAPRWPYKSEAIFAVAATILIVAGWVIIIQTTTIDRWDAGKFAIGLLSAWWLGCLMSAVRRRSIPENASSAAQQSSTATIQRQEPTSTSRAVGS